MKRKFLLVHPRPSSENFGESGLMPLGLAYIASILEKKGIDVEVLDMMIDGLSNIDFSEYVRKMKPWVVGFSSTTPQINNTFELAKIVKENSDSYVIFGGSHPSALPKESLLNKNVDYVIRGEGERTIGELIDNFDTPENVKGISYKKNGKIIHNTNRPFIDDLDSIPFPARRLFKFKEYPGPPVMGVQTPIGNIMTSRGCLYNCIFCYKGVFGNIFRARSAENVVEEWIELVHDFKAKEIMIVDDSFNTNKERAINICKKLIEEKLDTPWTCPVGIRVNTASMDLLKLMKKAGCYRVGLGVESGSQKVLNDIGKGVTLQQAEQAFKNMKKIGIETMAFFVLGTPTDTRETMEQSIAFAKKLNPDYCQFSIATPYPGTRLYGVVKNNLLISDWDDFGSYAGKAYFETNKLTKVLVEKMFKKAYRNFYLRPRFILKKLTFPGTYKHLDNHLKGLFTFLKPSD